MDYSPLHTALTNAQRIRLLRDHPIGRIGSAPGHRTLRNPQAVEAIAQAMRENRWDGLLSEPILIGIFTRVEDEKVLLRAVECLDGHHRLLAGLRARVWTSLGDIPETALDTRVNGWRADGAEAEPRWIPLHVAVRSGIPTSDWSEVPAGWGAKGPTAMIPGDVCGADSVFDAADRSAPLAALLDSVAS